MSTLSASSQDSVHSQQEACQALSRQLSVHVLPAFFFFFNFLLSSSSLLYFILSGIHVRRFFYLFFFCFLHLLLSKRLALPLELLSSFSLCTALTIKIANQHCTASYRQLYAKHTHTRTQTSFQKGIVFFFSFAITKLRSNNYTQEDADSHL